MFERWRKYSELSRPQAISMPAQKVFPSCRDLCGVS